MAGILRITKWLLHRFAVVVGAVGLTMLFFLVLPLMQSIGEPPDRDMSVQRVDVSTPPPPPPPEEEEPPEEEPEPEETPELEQEQQPLDLSQLEIALNPGTGEGGLAGNFSMDLKAAVGGGDTVDELFSLSDLDQRPRPIYQPAPNITAAMRRRAPGTVYVIFIVNQRGRVEEAKVQRSSHDIFEQPALAAVKQWKFEPGQRNGEPVRFRMRVPITFPEG